jgi:predicted membrane-bound spermidine synthase
VYDPIAGLMIPVICFLSGAAALVFESVWFHRASLVFGSSVWSTSLVLSSFMGGLALGSALVARRGGGAIGALRAYAIVETTVAVTGILLTLALPSLTSLIVAVTRPDSGNLLATNATRFGTAFLILLVPATAMGASLPLLVGAIDDRRPRGAFGSTLGVAYGFNTLGAVAGVIVGEVWLVERFGVAGTAWSAAALSLIAAGLAAIPAAPTVPTAPPQAAPADVSLRTHASKAGVLANGARPAGSMSLGLLLASSFVSGAALLALEVLWFRFLTLFVLSTTLAASVMLAAVLAGIALGGLAAGVWIGRRPTADAHLPAVAALSGVAVVASYAAFDGLTSGTQISVWRHTLWLALVMTLPTSLLSGVLFTLTGAAVERLVSAGPRAVGWLSVANTLGGSVGPLVAAFVLLPAVGTERALALVAGSYVLTAALTLIGLGAWRSGIRTASTWLASAAILSALVVFPFGAMQARHIPRIAAPYQTDGSTIVATREGPSETIFLMQQRWLDEPVYTRLVTNGFSMSGTSMSALRYMRYFAYWPAALHRGPLKNVLLVCFGVGVTASAVLDVPLVETLDIAEISPDVIETSTLIHQTDHPLKDPRVRLHVEDGRQFLERTSERFDLAPLPGLPGLPGPPALSAAQQVPARSADRVRALGGTALQRPTAVQSPR